MEHGRGEACGDTPCCWKFYLQKEFIACFLPLPLIVLVCESMTRRLAEGGPRSSEVTKQAVRVEFLD